MTDPIDAAINALIRECGTVTPSGSVNQFLEADSVEDLRDGMIAAIAAYRDPEIEALRAQVVAFKKYKLERECFTIDDWRIRAMNLEQSWSDCSRCCAVIQAERDNARAKLADCQAVIRHKGHDENCPASSNSCAICGLLELMHPCVIYFGDGQNHQFTRGPCSDACGHDRTTGEKA